MGIKFTDDIKTAIQMTLRCGDYLGLLAGANVITMSLKVEVTDRRECQRYIVRMIQPVIAHFVDRQREP